MNETDKSDVTIDAVESPSDKRSLPRVPCQIVVSKIGRSATLGEMTDISLDGAYIATSDPSWDKGTVLPLAFRLGDKGPEIQAQCLVMRASENSLGVKFQSMSAKNSRRLRRYVGELNAIVSHREAISRLHNIDTSSTVPLSDRRAIDEALKSGIGTKNFRVIPATRQIKQTSKLLELNETSLRFESVEAMSLLPDEEVFVIYAINYITHSFQTTVEKVSGKEFRLKFPVMLHYSERRSTTRVPAEPNSTIAIPLPWRPSEEAIFSLVDRSANGLSFVANAEEVSLWPGIVIDGCRIHTSTGNEKMDNLTIRRVVSYKHDDGTDWLTVGASFGFAREKLSTSQVTMQVERERKGLGRVMAWSRNLIAKAAYLYHTKLDKSGESTDEGTSQLVHFPNTKKQQIVGLLNQSFRGKQRVRAPVVIIVPGFANRKESLSALALTLTQNFRRHNRDIAVLRFDGTNNLGESYKDPECQGEGRHMLHYSVSSHISDILGALNWVKNNRFVEATDIVLISVSFSAVAVRRALTLPEASDVTSWISFMGASDAQNAMMNVSGNIDAYGNYLRGVKTGTITLLGCMSDADYSSKDMHELQVATLEDARKDMAKIKASVSWFIGKQDAFMDARRVHDIMTVKAPGAREIIEVNAGHVPTSSDEALSQFAIMTQNIWKHFYSVEEKAVLPSRGWLAAIAQQEWERVRRARAVVQTDYWKDYLLGPDDGLGFDLIYMTDEYRQLVTDQVELLKPQGKKILDLGAGTGNITRAVAMGKPSELVAVDLVPEALDRVKRKIGDGMVVSTYPVNIDGNHITVMRRWIAGEVVGVMDLVGRINSMTLNVATEIMSDYSPQMHAYLRGKDIEPRTLTASASLSKESQRAASDVHLLARYLKGLLVWDEIKDNLSGDVKTAIEEKPGLPSVIKDFDGVVCSLVLSYTEFPHDTLAETFRILRPGGALVLSSMLPDADTSKPYMDAIKYLETCTESDLPYGLGRETLLTGARAFMDKAAGLMRLEEEGTFQFWTGQELADMLREAGFENICIVPSFGKEPQAVIVKGTKPESAVEMIV